MSKGTFSTCATGFSPPVLVGIVVWGLELRVESLGPGSQGHNSSSPAALSFHTFSLSPGAPTNTFM